MKILYFCVLSITVISSCTPSIKDLTLYQKQFLTKSAHMPSKEQIKGKPPKIVVFSLDENGKVASDAKLGKSIATNLENIISTNRLGRLIDRRSAKRLQKEIALSEMKKTGSYKGPQIADFAISGSISNAGFTKKYNSATNIYNPKTGTYARIPANFKYSSQANGNVKILELPSLDLVESIEFDGYASRSENIQTQGGFQMGSLSIGGSQASGIDRDDNLVRDAGLDAIKNIETELKNSLATRGYILEKRTGEDFDIFKISIGSKNGTKHGDKVQIISKFDVTNDITDESEIESRVVSQGVISNIIERNHSWVIIKDKASSSKVRLGDQVRLEYKRGKFSEMMKKSRKYIN